MMQFLHPSYPFHTGGPYGQQAPRSAHPSRCLGRFDSGASVFDSREPVSSHD